MMKKQPKIDMGSYSDEEKKTLREVLEFAMTRAEGLASWEKEHGTRYQYRLQKARATECLVFLMDFFPEGK
jgi:hypothetical protein